MIPASFPAFLTDHDIRYAIVADLTTREMHHFGSLKTLRPDHGIAQVYFGDWASMDALDGSLPDRPLPRLVQ